jgi:DNA-directed RNA polymerase subunit beta
VAQDSGAVITSIRGGEVVQVTADEIVIDTGAIGAKSADQPLARLAQFDRYKLKKFWRTNQDTAINQRPLVKRGDKVKAGAILADGPSTDHGELALGRNLTVAFMPWFGYNFEDAIILSERLVRGDDLTSIHIQELELHVRDTKRGMEEITREIPNVSEEALLDLDERGVVRIGARVKAGDILCGKITPKGETELSPEEKLLTAIFGEKAKDVKDSSLRVPPGMAGDVIDVKVFSRRIDDPLLEKEHGARIGELKQTEKEETQRIMQARDEELRELLHLQTVVLFLKKGSTQPLIEEGTKLTHGDLAEVDLRKVDLQTLKVQNKEMAERIRRVIDEAQERIDAAKARTENQIDKVFDPDELPPGVVQLVKVYIAEKRKIAVGDKMAGRHGNKGIIAQIASEEDMPFLPDGTPVDVVLNPLGVPSRMNVGQILETHLGWASQILGFESKTPVFQGASEDEIGLLLKVAGLRWARDSQRLATEFPLKKVTDIRSLLKATTVDGVGEGKLSAYPAVTGRDAGVRGLGRSLDSYLAVELPKDTQAQFDRLRTFVVQAAKEWAERSEEPLESAFPAVAALESAATAQGK